MCNFMAIYFCVEQEGLQCMLLRYFAFSVSLVVIQLLSNNFYAMQIYMLKSATFFPENYMVIQLH